MKTLFKSALFLGILLIIFNGCSSGDEDGCGKVSNVTVYSTGPTYISFNFQPANNVNSYLIEFGRQDLPKVPGLLSQPHKLERLLKI